MAAAEERREENKDFDHDDGPSVGSASCVGSALLPCRVAVWSRVDDESSNHAQDKNNNHEAPWHKAVNEVAQ